MSKPFSSNATSSRDIVMQMLSDISQSLSPSLHLVVTVLSRKCCQIYVKAFHLHYNQQSRYSHENAVSYMLKPFPGITTSSHGIVMKMLSAIMSKPFSQLQLVIKVQLLICCQLYVKIFRLHYSQQSPNSHENAVIYMSKLFSSNTTSSHDIVTIQSLKYCQLHVQTFLLHCN